MWLGIEAGVSSALLTWSLPLKAIRCRDYTLKSTSNSHLQEIPYRKPMKHPIGRRLVVTYCSWSVTHHADVNVGFRSRFLACPLI